MISGNADNAGVREEAPAKETRGVGRTERATESMGQGQEPRNRGRRWLGAHLGADLYSL